MSGETFVPVPNRSNDHDQRARRCGFAREAPIEGVMSKRFVADSPVEGEDSNSRSASLGVDSREQNGPEVDRPLSRGTVVRIPSPPPVSLTPTDSR